MSRRLDVLIVEDDRWLGEQFERILEKSFHVHVTTNGHSAIDLIDELQPRVIILDVLLPGSTAMTLLHELQSYNDTAIIPIILCTNLASQMKLSDVEPYGVKRILDKTTMHPDDITAAVTSVLS